MCLCSEFNKRFSPNGLYHGRPIKVKSFQKIAPTPVMVKKTPQMVTKYKSS